MWDRLRYEVRIIGWPVLAVPLLTLTVITAFAAFLAFVGFAKMDTLLQSGPGEVCLSLAAGIVAAAIVAGETAVELQLTLPTAYAGTVFRRLALALVWMSVLGFVVTLAVGIAGRLGSQRSFALTQLSWFAPLCWAMAIGAFVPLLLRNRAIGVAAIGVVWGVQNIAHTGFNRRAELHWWYLLASTYSPTAPYWLTNRMTLLVTAAIVSVWCWLIVRDSERMAAGLD